MSGICSIGVDNTVIALIMSVSLLVKMTVSSFLIAMTNK